MDYEWKIIRTIRAATFCWSKFFIQKTYSNFGLVYPKSNANYKLYHPNSFDLINKSTWTSASDRRVYKRVPVARQVRVTPGTSVARRVDAEI